MGISIWQLLIVLGIVILLFGTKKLRNIGSDLGSAIRGFKKSLNEEEEAPARPEPENLEHKTTPDTAAAKPASTEKSQD